VVMVMEEGTNTRVLARLEHYELAGAGWMAAQRKLAEGTSPSGSVRKSSRGTTANRSLIRRCRICPLDFPLRPEICSGYISSVFCIREK
jgi:hypothetical protein